MTQEHREQFLATEGWQQTERGHIRGPEFGEIVLTYTNFQHVATVPRSRTPQSSRKFRRSLFGRQPKHDALMGWFDLGDKLLNRGGLRELNEMANKTGAYKDVSDGKPLTRVEVTWSLRDFAVAVPEKNSPINWDLIHPYGNKRQGWKTIEVGDGEKKEKVVVEVMG